MEAVRFLQQFANPFMDQFFIALTIFGEETVFMVIFAALYWCVDKEYSYQFGLTYLFGVVFNYSLKEIFRVPRPFGTEGIRSLRVETATGFSFPSGHTQGSATYLTSLILKYRRKWLTACGTAIVVMVGVSRLYLGNHRLNEVVAGAAFGVLWVGFFNRMYPHLKKLNQKSIAVLIGGIIIASMIFLHEADVYKTAGVISSLLAGCYFEARFIGLQVKAPWPLQLAKMLIGLAGVLLLKEGMKLFLPDILLSHFFRYMTIGLWASLGAPALFKLVFSSSDEKLLNKTLE